MYSGSRLEESLVEDMSPHILAAKRHEPQALKVESALQEQFRRSNLFVLPYTQHTGLKRANIRPCLRVVDARGAKTKFDGPAMQAVEKLYPQFYGEQSVYVSVDDLTIMPQGDALQSVVDHMLQLRYGHHNYSVEYDRHSWMPGKVSIFIDAVAFDLRPTKTGIEPLLRIAESVKNGDDIEHAPEARVPREVADFVLELSRRFRPLLTFNISEDTKLWNAKPQYAKGFTPAP